MQATAAKRHSVDQILSLHITPQSPEEEYNVLMCYFLNVECVISIFCCSVSIFLRLAIPKINTVSIHSASCCSKLSF